MQKPIDFNKNYLLSHVIRFLHKKESNLGNIETLIDSSSTENLVLLFSFLIKWLSNNLNDETEAEMFNDSIQSVIYIINKIIQKVPPIILYHELPENDIESNDSSNPLINDLLDPIKQRIMRLRSYILPNNIFHFHCTIPRSFYIKEENKKQKSNDNNILRIEKYINPNFEAQIFKHMKYLIVNHMPIQSFKYFPIFQHSRLILTNVIIELLDELNQTREATHEQLLFTFSSIFLYIYAFALNNDIDGHFLCKHLRSQIFLSPFCLLAMVKYIISYLYLFNLLTPKEYFLESPDIQESQNSTILQPYICVDLTNDATLSPLIQKIPIILINYFYPKIVKKENTISNNEVQDENNKFYIYMHLSTVEFNIKMRNVLMTAKEKSLNPAHVYSMGFLLLKYVIYSIHRTLVSCAEKEMFTPNFSDFVKTVFSILSTTFSDQLAFKFYDLTTTDNKAISVSICGSFLFLIPVILRSVRIENIVNFCLKAIQKDEITKNGRAMISKILICDYPKISPDLIDNIKETNDLITILIYIDSLTNVKRFRTFDEANKIEGCRSILLNQIVIGNNYSDDNNNNSNNDADKPFIFRPFKALSTINRPFNNFSKSIIEAYESPNQMQAMNELLSRITEEDKPWVIFYFFLTPCIANESFSETITDHVITGLENRVIKKNLKACNFTLNANNHYFVVSQLLLGRLVSFSYVKAAVRLSKAMTSYLSEDSGALHYITSFLAKYRSICPIGVLESFSQVVSILPCSDEYYEPNLSSESSSFSISGMINMNHSQLFDRVYSITEMISKYKYKVVQDPKVVSQEYQSPFEHAMAFAICIIGLTTSLQAQGSTGLSSSGNVVNEITDSSLNIISNSMNSFDFDGGQSSGFYPLMDFVSSFDGPTNFDSTSNSSFNQSSNFDSNTKPASNPNEIVPDSITDEIAEALLSPVTSFTKLWTNRDESIKICSLIAAQMDNKVAMKYLDLIIQGDNSELFVQAGVNFLINANLNILEYACQALINYITDYNTNFSNQGNNNNYSAKIDFFFKIIIPSVWRIQGENRVGMILLDGMLKSITQQTSKKKFNTIIDMISYVYLKLKLYENRNDIIQSAVNYGYSPEMVMLIESCFPINN